MKGDAVLDYVEFQLTAPRTRCELYVSANGVTEKLATGFLKPFLMHLKAVEEQIVQGRESVRLDNPKTAKDYLGRSWFTKGTIERFVRFVSTPEVLERVKSVEDELAQLEIVRNIQAASLMQVESSLFGGSAKNDDGNNSAVLEDRIAKLHPYKTVDITAEASKMELLRAMDLRLLALRQEQNASFTRAAAAGFNSGNMIDLVAFSEHFGANRLRAACLNFLEVLQRRYPERLVHDPQEAFGKHSIEKDPVHQLDTTASASVNIGLQKVVSRTQDMGFSLESDNSYMKGTGTVEPRKRWGPPENICPKGFFGQTNERMLMKENPEVQNCHENFLTENVTELSSKTSSLDTTWNSNASMVSGNSDIKQNAVSLEENRLERISTGNYSLGSYESEESEVSHHVSNTACQGQLSKLEGAVVETVIQEQLKTEDSTGSVTAPARRLSVQDAISLFENKQRRDSIDGSGKRSRGKHEKNRLSLETENAAAADVGQRGSLRAFETSGRQQESQTLGKQETQGIDIVIDSEPSSWALSLGLDAVHKDNELSNDQQLVLPDKFCESGNMMTAVSSGTYQCNVKGSAPDLHVWGTPLNYSSADQQNIAVSTGEGYQEKLSGISSDSNWRKQFKLQLEKSLLSKDKAVDDVILNSGSGENISGTHGNFHLQSSASSSVSHNTAIGSIQNASILRLGVSIGSTEASPVQDKSTKTDAATISSHMQRYHTAEVSTSAPNNGDTIEEDESSKNCVDANSDNNGDDGEFLHGAPFHSLHPTDMSALAQMANNQNLNKKSETYGSKGRFYDEYTRIRNAKLMEEQDSKRAEREAKFKTMEEMLTKKKAEMDARAVRTSRSVHIQSSASKLEDAKTDYSKLEEEDDDPGTGRSINKDQRNLSTGLTSQKSATPPRISTRGIAHSVSPKLTSKGIAGAITIPRRPAPSGGTENPLARSVPSFTNFRKENAKPSPGRESGSARIHSRNNGSSRSQAVIDIVPLETNVDVPTQSGARAGTMKGDKRNRMNPMRKSCATIRDFKALSNSSDGVMNHKSQTDSRINPTAHNKLRQSVAGPFQETKPSLKKTSRQKVNTAVDSKSSNRGETIIGTKDQVAVADAGNNMAVLNRYSTNLSEQLHTERENMRTEVTNEAEVSVKSGSSNDVEMQVVGPGDDSSDELEEKLRMPTDNFVGHPEKGCLSEDRSRMVSSSSDFKVHKGDDVGFGTVSDFASMLNIEVLSLRPEDSGVEYLRNQSTVSDINMSIQANSVPGERNSPTIPQMPASPPVLAVMQSGTTSNHLSPSSAATVDSPHGSPGSWNSSQIQCASGSDLFQMNKKWIASQKISTHAQPKEPVKGFKRLLKFGRKSRNAETPIAECVSASTTSEGDDEPEDQNRALDEASSQGRLQANKIPLDMAEDQCNLRDNSSQYVRSSIPIAPANFRLREDHLSGGTMLKAPRSFFSLSSFRSKSSESKAR